MISIIIVNYNVQKELFECIESIYNSKPRHKYEIIVVDNDEKKTIKKKLHTRFPNIIYVKNDNKGYGHANNLGVKHAAGDYIFILNPDTKIYPGCIDELVIHLEKNKKVAGTAPFLYQENKQPYPFQGAKILSPLFAIFSFSVISKFFPKNWIAKKYWIMDKWNGKSIKNVESVPGTAFMIRKKIFESVGGFDEKFFLFFEENDLCKRIVDLGWKMTMLPRAKVFHALGKSTKKSNKNINNIFISSRYYYFKKHYGLISAFVTEAILRLDKYIFMLLLILGIGSFLRFFLLYETMWFIGDQGWYYLAARDMLLSGNVPLVGIPSSHTWLHQGAYWTYILGGLFWLFGFNPLNGGYLAAFIDILSIIFIYIVGNNLFTRRVGLISALLYATSPLVVVDARMPYHTSPIPLFTLLYIYSIYKWSSGNIYFFPLTVFLLGILYNFEIATILLGFFTSLIFVYGLIRKKIWVKNFFDPKIIILSSVTFFVSMLPMLIYDINNFFAQTGGVLLWIGYHMLRVVGFPSLGVEQQIPFNAVISFVIERYNQLIFPDNSIVSLIVFLLCFLYSFTLLFARKNKRILLILFLNIFLVGGLIITKSPSSAYLPMIVPVLLLFSAIVIDRVMRIKFFKFPIIILLIFVATFNSKFLIDWLSGNALAGGSFKQRVEHAKYIVQEAKGKEYNLMGKGIGSEFPSLTMNYEYLTWWLGHSPDKKSQNLQFVVEQTSFGTKVYKIEKN